YYKADRVTRMPVLIFGAGVAGFLTKQAIEADLSSQYQLVGFLDDSLKKTRKDINGTRIYHYDQLPNLIRKFKVKKLIIAVKDLSVERKNEIVDDALRYNVRVGYRSEEHTSELQ